MNFDRRKFLQKSIHAALGGVGLYSALGNLRLVEAAALGGQPNGGFPDYKALVCVFLGGGNDSFNTIVPYDSGRYSIYQATRSGLALPQAAIQAHALSPLADGLPGDGGSYGLHSAMPEMRNLFNSGHAAIVANVGTLLYPITKQQYQQESVPVPPQLFSHSDQAIFWQTSRPDDSGANGWGGRIADLLHDGNPNSQLSMSVSLSGENLFQRGASVDQYVMSPYGAEPVGYLEEWDNAAGIQAFNALRAQGTQAHMFERGHAGALNRAIETYQTINGALDSAPTLTTPFPDTYLGIQLEMVAKLISVRNSLNMRRQVFFVSMDSFDSHGEQMQRHNENLIDVSRSLQAFYNATVELGVANAVTSFTASDFGRTLSINGDGTDHGWGGHHFVVGGAVRGQRFYGRVPSLLQNNNPDDAGYGQVIPTTSVDQYAATLASWFGVDASGIADIFPNLQRFGPTTNLGFMS